MNELVKETKLFSAQSSDARWLNALRGSSVSMADANNRKAEYAKLFSKYETLKEAYKTFSGVSEMPLMSNQYFNATVASFVRSFAGYGTIERDMAEPTALLWFDDVLGVVDERIVLPNIGKENLDGIASEIAFDNQSITNKTFEISTGKLLIPRTVRFSLVSADAATKVDIVDDGNGNLLAPAGVLSEGEVNYKLGRVKVTIASTAFDAGTYSMHASVDVPGEPAYGQIANNQAYRFKLGMKNIIVPSTPELLIGESNLVQMAMGSKSLGQNPMEVMGAKLVELFTKLINRQIVETLMSAHEGDAIEVDTTEWATTFYDYNSRLNAFSAEMVNVDTALADKSVKGVEATAYFVSPSAGNWFRKMRATGEFVEQKGSTYINDLLGTYHDIPVLRHNSIPKGEFYAVHKTPGGELAPVMFGTYLPLTFTPNIGSYQNPTQLATGCYYQIGMKPVASPLIQRVKLIE